MAPLYARYVPPKSAVASPTVNGLSSTTELPSSPRIPVTDDGRKKRKRSEAEEAERKARKEERKRAKVTKGVKHVDEHEAQPGGNLPLPVDGEHSLADGTDEDVLESHNETYGDNADDGEIDAMILDGEREEQHRSKKDMAVLSKYQKAAKRAAQVQALQDGEADEGGEPEEETELHDLVPLPQPPRAPTPEYVPTFSSLPEWLAKPTIISSSTRPSFSDPSLRLPAKTVSHLSSRGYDTAFAVQSALLPLLLPNPTLSNPPPNDICVSAPTGSGKTLGYVLPVVESLRSRLDTRLRACIVVPTRELVTQAKEVAAMCSAGSGLKIGVAVGHLNFVTEQETLVKKGRRYDPVEYNRLMAKAKRRFRCEEDDEDEDDEDVRAGEYMQAAVRMLPDHVPTYTPAVDILICTPGRLVEHLNGTLGFHLDDLEWLIIDEADRLLDQSFQEWVAKVVGSLETKKPESRMGSREKVLKRSRQSEERYVRKVILSATMTRDISKLGALRLRRPSMIVVKGAGGADEDLQGDSEGVQTIGIDGEEAFELPAGLREYAVPVGDGADKPLYLLELLRTRILKRSLDAMKEKALSDASDTSSDSESDSSNSSNSSNSSDSSDSDSDTTSSDSDTSDSNDSSDSSDSSESDDSSPQQPSPNRKVISQRRSQWTSSARLVLIFTPSTEAAARLYHLLTHLEPSYSDRTTLLTKSSSSLPTVLSKKAQKHDFHILISTDRASRGLDLPALTHVVNYALPTSLATYVHRVGRTARAGRSGEAWTLFADNEGRWFWNEIARSKSVRRPAKVERTKVVLSEMWKGGKEAEMGEGRKRFVQIVEGMRDLVTGAEKR